MFFDQMQASVKVPMISIVDATVKKITSSKSKRPLILGTPHTLNNRLYQEKLEKRGIDYIVPCEKDIGSIFEIIKYVLAGQDKFLLGQDLNMIIDKYQKADSVILACTELPLIAPYMGTELPIYDTLEILAEAVFDDVTNSNIMRTSR